MNVRLEEIQSLASTLLRIPDDRPRWMVEMPSANDEGQTQFARYYRFFYEFTKRWNPREVLELGTYKGTSAVHLAYPHASSRVLANVLTIDIDQAAGVIVEDIKAKNCSMNIFPIIGDTKVLHKSNVLLDRKGRVDLMFIDTAHDFEHCYGEYVLYREFMKDGGIIFFDNIRLCPEMELAWKSIKDPKVELPELHYTGFGACKVDRRITVEIGL